MTQNPTLAASHRRPVSVGGAAVKPVTMEEDWLDEAACAGEDPELFFPESWADTDAAGAKRVCRECPVRAECLRYALQFEFPGARVLWGIYGGLTPRERRQVIRRLPGARAVSAQKS